MLRDILKLRYTMLPIWYTAFREASVTGIPVLRPHYVVFPRDEAGFSIDDQWFIGGSGLLVKPVTQKDVTEASVYLADDQIYYDYFSHHAYRGGAKGKHVTVPAALHQVPLLIRGGSIIPTRERHRRSSPLMKLDPFTLRVALDQKGSARGELYLDDGETFSHQQGQIVWREFIAEKPAKKAKTLRLSSHDLAQKKPADAVDGVALTSIKPSNDFAKSIENVRVEKVIIFGLSGKPKSVKVEGGQDVDYIYTDGVAASGRREGVASVLVIKDPSVAVARDWAIVVEV